MASLFHSPGTDFPVSSRQPIEMGLMCADPSDFAVRRLLTIVTDWLPSSLHVQTHTVPKECGESLKAAGASICLIDDAVGVSGVARTIHALRDVNRRCACIVLTDSMDLELHSLYGEYGVAEILLWQDTTDPARAGFNVYKTICSALKQTIVEADLRDTKARFDFAWRSSPAPFFRIEGQGYILECNQSFAELLGYASPSDVVGRPLLEMEEPVAGNVYPFRGGASENLRSCCLRKRDGEGVVVELLDQVSPGEHLELARVARLGGPTYQMPVREGFVATQVSSESELRQELVQYETLYNSLFSAMAEGFIVADPRGRINTCNRVVETTMGIRLLDIHGQDLDQVLPIKSCDDEKTRKFSDIFDGRSRTFELTREGGSGEQPGESVWVKCKASLVEIPGATTPMRRKQFLISLVDVTPQIEAERRLVSAQLGSQLAQGMSHDMRNYLTAIASSASIMQRHLEGQDPILMEYAEQIEEVALNSAGLLDQGVRVTKQAEDATRQLLHVDYVVSSIDRLLTSLLPKGISLQVSLAAPSLTVLGLKGSIERIVINLVLNAKQALGRSGHIKVRTETALLGPDNPYEVAAGKVVMLSVRDDGPGISSEVKKRMFEPFFSGRQDGSGLGLSMVCELVFRLGGGLVCETSEGNGTTFRIALPFSDEGEPGSGLVPHATQHASVAAKRQR